MRLEASKKVLFVHVPQGAAKLQAVKLLVFQKIKSVHRNDRAFRAQNPHSKMAILQGKWAKSRVFMQGTVP